MDDRPSRTPQTAQVVQSRSRRQARLAEPCAIVIFGATAGAMDRQVRPDHRQEFRRRAWPRGQDRRGERRSRPGRVLRKGCPGSARRKGVSGPKRRIGPCRRRGLGCCQAPGRARATDPRRSAECRCASCRRWQPDGTNRRPRNPIAGAEQGAPRRSTSRIPKPPGRPPLWEQLIARRIATRHEHFMPPGLLHSQYEALEEPGPDENPVIVSIEPQPREIVAQTLSVLNMVERVQSPKQISPRSSVHSV
jgi:hypothetical protein